MGGGLIKITYRKKYSGQDSSSQKWDYGKEINKTPKVKKKVIIAKLLKPKYRQIACIHRTYVIRSGNELADVLVRHANFG